jgi:amino acid adenylation domain-containing protein
MLQQGEDSPISRPSVIYAIYDVMSQTPHAIAVTEADLEWTYDALRRHSDVVARSLADHGIAQGSVVGMHLPRSADAIATMIGIMAFGCVYLPLDPSYPSARVRFMLDQSNAIAVISDANKPDLYGSHRVWLPSPSQVATESEITTDDPSIYVAGAQPFRIGDPAYILFTSGSTGEPKGVMVTHENMTLMIEGTAKVLGVTQFDASATATSLSFDPCFQEILVPLSVGGTVHVIPHVLALGQLTRQVSYIACTSTVANELLRAGLLPSLKVLMVGGEILAPDVAARLLSSGRVGRLLNCYGPTECTVCVTVAEVTAPVPEIIPIGQQVPGTEVRILGDEGQPLPDCELGEICIFGGQVATGYVNDPAGTAERFIVRLDPATGPQRYYRTGDLGYQIDGIVYFAGRTDRQVKINGHRIELGEVDTVLRCHPQISGATAIVQDDDQLVAYVVPGNASIGVDVADVKRHLSENLPRFMLPAGVIVLAELPKTVNGKLDVTALPRWSPSRSEYKPVSIDEYTTRVIQIVADATGFVGQILPSDDFIDDLGGTSLGIVQVLVELERYSGRRLRMSAALADTSVAGLAHLLRGDSESLLADFAFHTDGNASPLFLIHSYLGGMLRLRHLAELLPPNQPVYGLLVQCTSEQVSGTFTISSLAQDALRRIRAIQPTGKITIAGNSAGGLIAFEAARQLMDAGDPEPRVLLIDVARMRSIVEYYWSEWLPYLSVMRGMSIGELIKRLPAAWQRRVHRGSRSRRGNMADNSLMTLAEKYQKSTDMLVRRYRARTYNGSIALIVTRQGRMMAFGQKDLGWASVTKGELKLIDVPGAHLSMFDAPHIDFVSDAVARWLSDE